MVTCFPPGMYYIIPQFEGRNFSPVKGPVTTPAPSHPPAGAGAGGGGVTESRQEREGEGQSQGS